MTASLRYQLSDNPVLRAAYEYALINEARASTALDGETVVLDSCHLRVADGPWQIRDDCQHRSELT